jgi:lysophospholipase L1-like esterase
MGKVTSQSVPKDVLSATQKIVRYKTIDEINSQLNVNSNQLNEMYYNMTKSTIKSISCWGDSITEGGSPGDPWATILDGLLPSDVVVNNFGVSGQCSGSIAARQGGNIITVDAFTLPADSSQATITIHPTAGTTRNMNGSLNCQIAGIDCILVCDNSTTAKINRTWAGTSTPISNGTQIMFPQGINKESDLCIFWVGRNDVAFSYPNQIDGPTSNIKAMVNHLTPQIKRFLVISTTTASDEIKGSEGYNNVIGINNALKETFPYNFLDVRRYLIDDGLRDAGIKPSTLDNNAITNDTIPPSLLNDTIHPNLTAKPLIAKLIFNTLKEKGWV